MLLEAPPPFPWRMLQLQEMSAVAGAQVARRGCMWSWGGPLPEFQLWLWRKGRRELEVLAVAGGPQALMRLWGSGPLDAPRISGANVRNRFGQCSVIRMGVSLNSGYVHGFGNPTGVGESAPDQPLAVRVTPDKALLPSESQVLHL